MRWTFEDRIPPARPSPMMWAGRMIGVGHRGESDSMTTRSSSSSSSSSSSLISSFSACATLPGNCYWGVITTTDCVVVRFMAGLL